MEKTVSTIDIEAQQAEDSTEVQTTSKKKQLALTAIKAIVSALLIYWILRGTDFSKIFAAIGSASIPLLILSFSLHFVGFFVSALRWKILLKAQSVDSKMKYLITSYIVAMFVNHLLPSTFGGDTVRAYDSYRVGKSKSGAVAVIFVDRFLGLSALMLYALVAVFFATQITSKVPYLYLWVLMGAVGMAFIIWIIFMPPRRLPEFVAKLKIPFSSKIQKILEKIINAFWVFKGQKSVLMKAFGLSLILQANVVTYYFLISSALDFHIAYYNFFLIVPLAIFIMMMPISINGIGLRENAFFFFLGAFAIAKPEAIAFAWIEYGILLLQGVLGGIVYALRK
jgi:uncharacterized protein (TIRG00374 family)